jgi:hypothetical protein
VSRSYRGRLRGSKTVRIAVGAGRLTVKLTSSSVKGCRLTVASSNEVLLATQRRRMLLALAARVPAGSYAVSIRCKSGVPRRYRLSIVGVAAPSPDAGARTGG